MLEETTNNKQYSKDLKAMENSRFTNAEGGTRLIDVAHKKNTLIAEHTSFVATRLLHEQAFNIRGSLMDGKQRSIYVTRSSRVPCVAYDFNILTDLKILASVNYNDVEDWHEALEVSEVLVCTSEVFQSILKDGILSMKEINVLVLDSCHLISKDEHIKYIMKLYKECEENRRPKILALTYPLFSHNSKNNKNNESETNVSKDNENSTDVNKVAEDIENLQLDDKTNNIEIEKKLGNDDNFDMYEKFEWKIDTLEKELSCEADFAEDIDNTKRLSTTTNKPKELIIEYSELRDISVLSEHYMKLDTFMREAINDVIEFLDEHRYDPTEIYGEDMYEELKAIPDPTLEPKNMLQQFLYVLDQLGPYGADKAAFTLLIKLEKLKIKVPYERHFLLLCLCTTAFIKIRAEAESVFENFENEWERIKRFCTPKILRFTEILCKFKPPSDGSLNELKEVSNNLLGDIEKCNFKALGHKLEDSINTISSNLKELPKIEAPKKFDRVSDQPKFSSKRPRTRGRVRSTKNNLAKLLQMQANPDALCGVVFIKDALMAKVLFLIVVDLSRSHKDLSFLCAQYSAGALIEDGNDTKQCEIQRKKQEDVLKRFRIHECNLLLATLAIEEGIDLPRCNLVLRWDVPNSYRSYGLCRGRARANKSVNIVLAEANKTFTEELVQNIATYEELDQIITRKCGCGIQNEPTPLEEQNADLYTPLVKAYSPGITKPHINTNVNNIKKDLNKVNSNFCMKCVGKNECSCAIKSEEIASVDLSTAISLINRYCGKLPSDTFTRLAPQWWVEEVMLPVKKPRGELKKAYICTLRLPLNCPVKYNIVGHPMPTEVLARRMVALQACRILHKSGELDNQLMPIGKENFKAMDNNNINVAENINESNDLARPGTTKRRQYYYKRTAWAFTDCQPVIDTEDSELNSPENITQNSLPKVNNGHCDKKPGTKHNVLYALVSRLWCSLPERYNTRGRRLHAPQHARQALGILTARVSGDSFQIPAFPVYTRSGEIRVSVEPVADADVRLTPRRGRLIRRFMRFIFAEVLRVRRRGMKLQIEGQTQNNYYVVPTIRKTKEDGTIKTDIDWDFLELIYQHTEERKHSDIEKPVLWHQDEEEEEDIKKPVQQNSTEDSNIISEEISNKVKPKEMVNPLLKEGEMFVFDPDKFREAVVTPWYRNQDLPQYFLVAEICTSLTPDSPFPSATHTSFRDYYTTKYSVPVTQSNQPLLDVDHTSARLNLLTPRYVNRKGVALPVSSERTRRAKRDRLDQKQILIPELCRVHPFAAPLWFATVALPCVLYRINALLIADEIRRCVAIDVGLGLPKLDEETCPGFEWPPLDFGWSLAEVLSMDSEKEKSKKEPIKELPSDNNTEIVNVTEKTENEEDSNKEMVEVKEKTINEILQKEKEDAENSGFEIGTWTNDMASSIPLTTDFEEEFNEMGPLPPNLTFCTSASGGTNWSAVMQNKPANKYNHSSAFSVANSDCSYMSSDFDTDDSDLDSDYSDEDVNGFCSNKNTNAAIGIRIEYKTAHEAEAVDLRREKKVKLAPQPDPEDDETDRLIYEQFLVEGNVPDKYKQKFKKSVEEHKKEILNEDFLIKHDVMIEHLLPDLNRIKKANEQDLDKNVTEIFPYETSINIYNENNEICIENIEISKRIIFENIKNKLGSEELKKLNCFSMKDVNIDASDYVNEKLSNIGFDEKDTYEERANSFKKFVFDKEAYFQKDRNQNKKQDFNFDYQPKLEGHPGPSPSVILQALTMSNANDGINLERLETIGDSFLKFAITAYLYCAHPTVHEGKLSHMRSKQVSNLSLYRLGRNKRLGARMIASKFEPHDNWLPPCHKPPPTLGPKTMSDTQSSQAPSHCVVHGAFRNTTESEPDKCTCFTQTGCFIPYNLITQHSIPDKSLADCVEALIGAYLIETGPRGALLFMSWLGIQVLPKHVVKLSKDHPYVKREMDKSSDNVPEEMQKPNPPSPKRYEDSSESEDSWSDDENYNTEEILYEDTIEYENWSWESRLVGSTRPIRDADGQWVQTVYGELKPPPSPLLRYVEDPEGELEQMLSGYEALENTIQYRFKDRSLLLQALTHASHHQNRLTDCYQRLEFLGDAILDYLITRYLYEDERRHSPGALTDLRSALVNNTIFATLAVRHGFHKYFRHMSPGLNEVLTKYVKIQEENGHSISEEHYLIQEDEMEQAEDVEVPKALGDLFESVAGAIYLDSGMSLGAVWRSYVNLMGAELEAFSACAPKSPVRELLEAEPDTAKFGKPERLADGRRVRVSVEVFGRGTFKGIGRNYRIAKGTAARCALRHLKKLYRS